MKWLHGVCSCACVVARVIAYACANVLSRDWAVWLGPGLVFGPSLVIDPGLVLGPDLVSFNSHLVDFGKNVRNFFGLMGFAYRVLDVDGLCGA
jgi:hypothetical protein